MSLYSYSCPPKHKTFRNPVTDEQAPACFIAKHGGHYYMTFTVWDRIDLLRSPTLSNFRNAERKEIYRPPDNMSLLLSPEMHFIDGSLYIYFSMGEDIASQRMFVIKCLDPEDPMGDWTAETRLMPEEDLYAIHGTIMQIHEDNNLGCGLYFLWASIETRGFHPLSSDSINLYIAKMENPLKVNTPRILLRKPTMGWELHNFPVNEAPAILQNNGRTLLIFSASHVSSPDCCLGIMGIDGGRDPTVVTNWWSDVNRSVFGRNDIEGVWAPTHACFVRSPDDSEIWMVYDAWDDINDKARNRRARIQRIEWEMNSPRFPLAMGIHQDLEVPSGE